MHECLLSQGYVVRREGTIKPSEDPRKDDVLNANGDGYIVQGGDRKFQKVNANKINQSNVYFFQMRLNKLLINQDLKLHHF